MQALIGPFPENAYALAWEWLLLDPDFNFDDDGPRTFHDFVVEMERRREAGEIVAGVRDADGGIVGIIGVRPINHAWALFHGICFAPAVRGTPLTRAAVKSVLDGCFGLGYRKVSAWHFLDNERVHRFLLALGAQEEGILRRHVPRHGEFIDLRLLAFFKE